VQGLLKNWGLDRASKEQKVFTDWQEALGETLARTTRPVAVHHGSLVIAVKDSSWMQELQFMKTDIIKKLNRALGKAVIQEVRFRVMTWDDSDPRAPNADDLKPGTEIELDPAVIEEARQAAAVIQDPRLREQILKTLLASARKEAAQKQEGN